MHYLTLLALLCLNLTHDNCYGQVDIEVVTKLFEVTLGDVPFEVSSDWTKISANPVSELVEFGNAGGIHYAWKIELLESNIDDSVSYIIRYNLFEKINDVQPWNKLNSTTYAYPDIKSANHKFDLDAQDEIGGQLSVGNTAHRYDGLPDESFYIKYDLLLRWKN